MIVILLTLSIVLFIPYIVDGINLLKCAFKRRGIGQWNTYSEWSDAVEKINEKWILNTPTVKKTDNNRLIIIDMLKHDYKNNTIQSWQKGLSYLAHIENSDKDYIHYFLDSDGNWINEPTEIDYAILAFAILKSALDKEFIKNAMDFMYNLIVNKIGDDNTVMYRNSCPNYRFVDTVGFITPFLAYYGITYNKKDAIDLSLNQLSAYYKYGFDIHSGLPVHVYDIKTFNHLGIYGWGRGAGWYLLGLIDTYLILKDDQLKSIISSLANQYLIYQNENGSFSPIMQLKDGSDSSITSIMAYYYSVCADIFENKLYYDCSKKCLEYLKSVTRKNGEIDYSQGDTKGIGYYSITYDIMPFTQGMTCRAINSIRSIEKKYGEFKN